MLAGHSSGCCWNAGGVSLGATRGLLGASGVQRGVACEAGAQREACRAAAAAAHLAAHSRAACSCSSGSSSSAGSCWAAAQLANLGGCQTAPAERQTEDGAGGQAALVSVQQACVLWGQRAGATHSGLLPSRHLKGCPAFSCPCSTSRHLPQPCSTHFNHVDVGCWAAASLAPAPAGWAPVAGSRFTACDPHQQGKVAGLPAPATASCRCLVHPLATLLSLVAAVPRHGGCCCC